jgi:hypothetical protein
VKAGQDSGPGTTTGDSGTTANPDSGMGATSTISASTTWTGAVAIGMSTTIAAGVTVTVASGATVSFATGATLTIDGTLTSGMAAGATLSGTGSGTWGGLVVGSGGTLSVDGVAITNATTAIETQAGDTAATYDDATITGASTPFKVDKGSTLSVTHATVAGSVAPGTSAILGAFTASYLAYGSLANEEGIVMQDPTATLSVEDSTLTGQCPMGSCSGDMLVSSTGASMHVAYTKITAVHCGFHFDSINEYDISYTSAESDAYGAMLWGSTPGAGPYTIKSSNFDQDSSSTLDVEGTNGTIVVDSCYVSGPMTGVTATNPQTAAVPNAGPR